MPYLKREIDFVPRKCLIPDSDNQMNDIGVAVNRLTGESAIETTNSSITKKNSSIYGRR